MDYSNRSVYEGAMNSGIQRNNLVAKDGGWELGGFGDWFYGVLLIISLDFYRPQIQRTGAFSLNVTALSVNVTDSIPVSSFKSINDDSLF